MTHQPVLRCAAWKLTLSCTCTAYWPGHGGRPRHEVIDARPVFPAADVDAAWRAWHEQQGVELP